MGGHEQDRVGPGLASGNGMVDGLVATLSGHT